MPFHPYLKEYEMFMDHFHTNYPELYFKYCKNITIGCSENHKVSVNNNFDITLEAHAMLIIIATDYYKQKTIQSIPID